MKNKRCFSISAKSISDFKLLLEEKISELGKPSLAIIFAHADLDLSGINSYVTEMGIPHIGASSYGEICDEKFYSGVYTSLFLYLSDQDFKIYTSEENTSILDGTDLGKFANQSFQNPGIYMLIASMDTATDIYINDVQKATNDNIPLYGGHAIDNLKFEKYTVFSNNYLSFKGVVAIVFDSDKVGIYGDSFSGWDSIGATHEITKSENNELLEIDGKPALDVFTEYFDYFDLDKVTKGEESNFIIGNHPIKVIGEDGASSLKSPIHLNLDRKSMSYYCSVPIGTKFQFCSNPGLDISDKLVERAKKVKAKYDELDCLLITSCASRNLVLGPFFKKEVARLYELWDKPTAGFLSGGEIGNVIESNKSTFHNVTCIFTGFKIK